MTEHSGDSAGVRTEHGNCHTEPCRSLRCPCFISGEHDPSGADHLAEMMEHAQRADHAEDLLRRALKSHDAIVASYRAGSRRAPFKAIDDMVAVKAAAIEMDCYPAPASVLRAGLSDRSDSQSIYEETPCKGTK